MPGIEASRLVRALEQIWGTIRLRHPDVPLVVVILGAGSVGVPRGVLKLGHFAADRWTSGGSDAGALAELFVAGKGLAQGAESVLATLLREAAHGLADARRIQDTSRQGRYHNARFKALGEELGLTITHREGIGWSGTDLADGTAAQYATELVQMAAAITAYRYAEGSLPTSGGGSGGAGKGGGKGGAGGSGRSAPKNGLVLVCDCQRRIRISSSSAATGPIICGVCSGEFVPVGTSTPGVSQLAASSMGRSGAAWPAFPRRSSWEVRPEQGQLASRRRQRGRCRIGRGR